MRNRNIFQLIQKLHNINVLIQSENVVGLRSRDPRTYY